MQIKLLIKTTLKLVCLGFTQDVSAVYKRCTITCSLQIGKVLWWSGKVFESLLAYPMVTGCEAGSATLSGGSKKLMLSFAPLSTIMSFSSRPGDVPSSLPPPPPSTTLLLAFRLAYKQCDDRKTHVSLNIPLAIRKMTLSGDSYILV